MRDTLLALSGKLDATMGGQPFSLGEAISGKGKNRYATVDLGPKTPPNRRTVYAIIDRSGLPDMFNTFDFAQPRRMTTGERILTTVPQQALFLMNSPFMMEQVKALSWLAPTSLSAGTDEEKVRFLFRAIYQRAPLAPELELAQAIILSSDAATAPLRASGDRGGRGQSHAHT